MFIYIYDTSIEVIIDLYHLLNLCHQFDKQFKVGLRKCWCNLKFHIAIRCELHNINFKSMYMLYPQDMSICQYDKDVTNYQNEHLGVTTRLSYNHADNIFNLFFSSSTYKCTLKLNQLI